MTRAGCELDADRFQVVIGIVQRMDFEFAAIARTGVNVADDERPSDLLEHGVGQLLGRGAQFLVGFRRRFADDSCTKDFSEHRKHDRGDL